MESTPRFSGVHETDWLAPATREALILAGEEARRLRNAQIFPEHLLLGLLASEESQLAALFQAHGINLTRVCERVQERFEPLAAPSATEDLALSEEAQECLRRAIQALVAEQPYPHASKQVSPAWLTLSLLAHPRVQHVLVPSVTAVLLVSLQVIQQIQPVPFWRIERRFLFAHSPKQEEQITFHQVQAGPHRRVLKCIEPPHYRFRDLPGTPVLHPDLLGFASFLSNAQNAALPSCGQLLILPPKKGIKQIVRAIAGEGGVPLITVFCSVLAEFWQTTAEVQQGLLALRELFLSLRLLSVGLIYWEGLDLLADLNEADEQEERPSSGPTFWTVFLKELDALLAQSGLIVLAASQRPEALPSALRLPSRLGPGLMIDGLSEARKNQPLRGSAGRKALHYSLVGPRLRCSSCWRPVLEAWHYCVYCGASVSRACPACGTPLAAFAGARFCSHCGRRVR